MLKKDYVFFKDRLQLKPLEAWYTFKKHLNHTQHCQLYILLINRLFNAPPKMEHCPHDFLFTPCKSTSPLADALKNISIPGVSSAESLVGLISLILPFGSTGMIKNIKVNEEENQEFLFIRSRHGNMENV